MRQRDATGNGQGPENALHFRYEIPSFTGETEKQRDGIQKISAPPRLRVKFSVLIILFRRNLPSK